MTNQFRVSDTTRIVGKTRDFPDPKIDANKRLVDTCGRRAGLVDSFNKSGLGAISLELHCLLLMHVGLVLLVALDWLINIIMVMVHIGCWSACGYWIQSVTSHNCVFLKLHLPRV